MWEDGYRGDALSSYSLVTWRSGYTHGIGTHVYGHGKNKKIGARGFCSSQSAQSAQYGNRGQTNSFYINGIYHDQEQRIAKKYCGKTKRWHSHQFKKVKEMVENEGNCGPMRLTGGGILTDAGAIFLSSSAVILHRFFSVLKCRELRTAHSLGIGLTSGRDGSSEFRIVDNKSSVLLYRSIRDLRGNLSV